jgi:hypothetical protein
MVWFSWEKGLKDQAVLGLTNMPPISIKPWRQSTANASEVLAAGTRIDAQFQPAPSFAVRVIAANRQHDPRELQQQNNHAQTHQVFFDLLVRFHFNPSGVSPNVSFEPPPERSSTLHAPSGRGLTQVMGIKRTATAEPT